MERIPLSNAAFEGDNNAYLLADGAETVLVDTGDPSEATREQLRAGLADRGVGFEDVDRILLTHWHRDHAGLAGEIQAASGATVNVHAADAPLVAGDRESWDALHALQERYFDDWGMPEAKQATLRERMGAIGSDTPPAVTPVEDGDVLPVGERDLRVVHAPGHAAGQCLFTVDGGTGTVAYTGDALLPVYTPNVGGADVRVDDPLAKYLGTLRAIADAGYARALPGHRDPIEDPAARAEAIVRHHEERAWRVLTTLEREGPADAWTVSAALFGDLDGIHVLHGPGEVYAHLEHLERAGTVVADESDYRLAADVEETLSGTDGRWPL